MAPKPSSGDPNDPKKPTGSKAPKASGPKTADPPLGPEQDSKKAGPAKDKGVDLKKDTRPPKLEVRSHETPGPKRDAEASTRPVTMPLERMSRLGISSKGKENVEPSSRAGPGPKSTSESGSAVRPTRTVPDPAPASYPCSSTSRDPSEYAAILTGGKVTAIKGS